MDNAPIIDDYDHLNALLRRDHSGKKIVCTIGSWDVLHRGHVEYLKRAKNEGDVLVVGVDSDSAFQRYKKRSPLIPQEDRFAMISSIRFIDYVAPIYDVDEGGNWKFGLVKSIKPDVFYCTYQTYSEEQREQLSKLCTLKISNLTTTDAPSVVVTQKMKELILKTKENDINMRMNAFQFLAVFLALSILTTVFLVIWTAFRGTNLSQYTLDLLIVKTIPETVGMMYI